MNKIFFLFLFVSITTFFACHVSPDLDVNPISTKVIGNYETLNQSTSTCTGTEITYPARIVRTTTLPGQPAQVLTYTRFEYVDYWGTTKYINGPFEDPGYRTATITLCVMCPPPFRCPAGESLTRVCCFH